MPFTRCNTLVYRAPLTTLGDLPDTPSVLAVLAQLAFLIVDKQAGAANAALVELLNALVTVNPTCKVFGRVSVGTAPDLATVEAAMDLWTTDVPPELLAGFCLDMVDFAAGATATRANLNTLVDKAHALAKGVVMDATNLYNVLEPYPGEAVPKFGRDVANRDYLLVHGLLAVNPLVAGPALPEGAEHHAGQLDYLASAKTDRLTGIGALNFGVLALMGAGNASFIDDATFKSLLQMGNAQGFEGVGLEPWDGGATSHQFFLTGTANASGV